MNRMGRFGKRKHRTEDSVMNNGTTAMIDVRRDIGNQARQAIEEGLVETAGINHAAFSRHVNRLVLVRYEPTTVSATQINGKVREYLDADGPATCLIGM
jgi:hypothetical protein